MGSGPSLRATSRKAAPQHLKQMGETSAQKIHRRKHEKKRCCGDESRLQALAPAGNLCRETSHSDLRKETTEEDKNDQAALPI